MSAIPAAIGKYKVESMVAKGGMGLVYLAEHPTLKSKIIIKKLTIRGNALVLKRFQREARILLELQHANIVRMFDYFTEGNSHYIALEYVDGMSLDKLLEKRKKLSWLLALLIVRDACKALVYAHARGIIHRDVKPGNILLSKQGAIKLTDFGIAFSEREENEDGSITRSGVTLGTPAYMPPEQFSNSDAVDCRADIYALGIMFYEMLTGSKPYKGNMNPDTLERIRRGKYTSAKKLEKTIPFRINRIMRKMMHAKPHLRYKTAQDLLKAVNKELKHFEQKKIRISLVKLILSPSYTEEVYESRYKKLHTYAVYTAAALVFAFVAFFCWHRGYIHRTLLRSFYTPISLSLHLPQTASVNPDIPVSALFFYNDAAHIPEVPNTKRYFYPATGKGKNVLWHIKPVYLRKGNYRIKISAGPYVWWKSIDITDKEAHFTIDFSSKASRPLKVHMQAFDIKTGEDISTKTQFSFLHGNLWLLLDEQAAKHLMSGNVWKFRAESSGYKTEFFSLRIEWYQDELFISALLDSE